MRLEHKQLWRKFQHRVNALYYRQFTPGIDEAQRKRYYRRVDKVMKGLAKLLAEAEKEP